MQIKFTPHKIRASKAYITNLIKNENRLKRENIKRELPLIKKILRFFTRG